MVLILAASLTDDQKRWFIDYYKRICKLGVKDSDRPNNRDFENETIIRQHVRKTNLIIIIYPLLI